MSLDDIMQRVERIRRKRMVRELYDTCLHGTTPERFAIGQALAPLVFVGKDYFERATDEWFDSSDMHFEHGEPIFKHFAALYPDEFLDRYRTASVDWKRILVNSLHFVPESHTPQLVEEVRVLVHAAEKYVSLPDGVFAEICKRDPDAAFEIVESKLPMMATEFERNLGTLFTADKERSTRIYWEFRKAEVKILEHNRRAAHALETGDHYEGLELDLELPFRYNPEQPDLGAIETSETYVRSCVADPIAFAQQYLRDIRSGLPQQDSQTMFRPLEVRVLLLAAVSRDSPQLFEEAFTETVETFKHREDLIPFLFPLINTLDYVELVNPQLAAKLSSGSQWTDTLEVDAEQLKHLRSQSLFGLGEFSKKIMYGPAFQLGEIRPRLFPIFAELFPEAANVLVHDEEQSHFIPTEDVYRELATRKPAFFSELTDILFSGLKHAVARGSSRRNEPDYHMCVPWIGSLLAVDPAKAYTILRTLVNSENPLMRHIGATTLTSFAMTLQVDSLLPIQDEEYAQFAYLAEHNKDDPALVESLTTLATRNDHQRVSRILSHRPECPLDELVELASIEGPFVPVERLGEGSKGTTYKVFMPGIGQFRALKILKEGKQPNEDEGKILGTLRGEDLDNIVQVYDAGTDIAAVNGQQRYSILMEYIDGSTLRQSFPEPDAKQALLVGARLLRGIDSLRKRGITHRDLNLDNIMTYDVDGLKIVDFGLATREPNPIQVDARRYGSPGQADDLFSLGLIMYRLATGEHLVTPRTDSMTTDTYAQAVMDMKTELYEGELLSVPYQRRINRIGKPLSDVILSCLLTTQPALGEVLHTIDDISVELSLYTRSRMDLWLSLYKAEKQVHSLAAENDRLRKENDALRSEP